MASGCTILSAAELRERFRHDVADDVHTCRDALTLEMTRGGLAGTEQQIRQVIGEDAVDLLGHRSVEGTEPGLDVGYRDFQLRRRQRAGECRIGVAVDQHAVRPLLGDHFLDRNQHAGGLHAVRR